MHRRPPRRRHQHAPLELAPLTPRELTALVARLSYKPDARLDVRWDRPTIDLIITLTVPSLAAPHRPIAILSTCALSPADLEALDEPRALALIHRLLLKGESHELDEWFRLDGRPVHPPHHDAP